MQIQSGEYVITRHRSTTGRDQDALIKVKNVSGDTVFGRLEHDPHIHNKLVEVSVDSVIMNLGSKPHPGKVHGFDLTSLYRGAVDHPKFGDIHFFEKTKKEKREQLFASMTRVQKMYAKQGIDVTKLPILHEVHPRRGKYAGMYHHSKDLSKHQSRISYFVDACNTDAEMDYMVAHELAHGTDFILIQPNKKACANWIKVYNASIATHSISRADNKALVHSFAGSESESVREWVSSLGDELKEPARYALHYLRQVRGLSVRELDTLIATGDKDEIVRLWPKVEVDVRSPEKFLVTEYATKNVHELVAESLAFFVLGKTLPELVTTLVEKSFRLARINFKEYA